MKKSQLKELIKEVISYKDGNYRSKYHFYIHKAIVDYIAGNEGLEMFKKRQEIEDFADGLAMFIDDELNDKGFDIVKKIK